LLCTDFRPLLWGPQRVTRSLSDHRIRHFAELRLPHRRLLRRFDSATPSNYLSIALDGYSPGFGWLCIAAYHGGAFSLRTLPLIFSHCCVPICLRHVHLRFVFSALRLPRISSANNAAACALVSPSISSAPCTRLRYLWHCFASLHLAYFKIPFRVRFVPLLFDLRHRIISFRLSCLQLHSTSTFSIHLVARSCDLPEGG
jgi:hypothetical protein